jgi:hypothetical protein
MALGNGHALPRENPPRGAIPGFYCCIGGPSASRQTNCKPENRQRRCPSRGSFIIRRGTQDPRGHLDPDIR